MTLFGVLINDICDVLPPTVNKSLFVDDFAVLMTSPSPRRGRREERNWSLSTGGRPGARQ